MKHYVLRFVATDVMGEIGLSLMIVFTSGADVMPPTVNFTLRTDHRALSLTRYFDHPEVLIERVKMAYHANPEFIDLLHAVCELLNRHSDPEVVRWQPIAAAAVSESLVPSS